MISNQNNKINKQSKVTIVMPCFNEELTIYEIIKRVLKEECVGELIIVDDGSTDGTLRNIEKIRNKRVSVLKNKKNFGKGYSVRRGIEVARFPIIGIQDADLEYSPKDYEKLAFGGGAVMFAGRPPPCCPPPIAPEGRRICPPCEDASGAGVVGAGAGAAASGLLQPETATRAKPHSVSATNVVFICTVLPTGCS